IDFYIFFFSSRRRHTRWPRDWSSDVCSSDLFYSGHAAATATSAGLTCAHHQHLPLYGGGLADLVPCLVMSGVSIVTGISRIGARSEERRVGKECRSRWWLRQK